MRRTFYLLLLIFCFFCFSDSVYAAEDEFITFDFTTRLYEYYGPSRSFYRYGYLTYDYLLNELGQTPSSELTFIINSVTVDSYSSSSLGGTVYWQNVAPGSDFTYCQVDYTNGSGGDGTDSVYKGVETVIDYGGGDISFTAYPQAGYVWDSQLTFGAFIEIYTTINISIKKPAVPPLTDNEALNKIANQQEQFHEEERSNAQQAGNDAGSLFTELQSIESKWEILWLPIKFTSQVIDVFSGGTSSVTYSRSFSNIDGYVYDEETGFLVPIRSEISTYADVEVPGGASITFPAYTLPVLNVQIWDSYTFDLTTLKDDFSFLFNALYVVISVLEVYWFIGFCREKYHDVFD